MYVNRKLISIIVALISSTAVFTACDFADESEEGLTIRNLENTIAEELKEEINEEDITILDLDNDNKQECIVKYRTLGSEKPLRIMILSEKEGKPKVEDIIKNVGEDFDEIQYIDMNNDGNLEIVAGFKAGESLSRGISIYKYKDGKSMEIFEEYYSDYILKDINNDGNKEIVIIKEREKDEKSYAYLYKWQEKGFENTKKVEIDPTLDSEEVIIEKLL